MSEPIKASFDDLYAMYSPKEYVRTLMQDLNYDLPFHTMGKLKAYLHALLPQDTVRTTFVGSSHGLDAVALKYDFKPEEILARWTDDDTIEQPFPSSESGIEATFIDAQPEPLRFAHNVNLAEKSLVANLTQPYSDELQDHFTRMTDVVTAIGVTSYLGPEGLEQIVETAFVNGDAQLLCFAVVKYLHTNALLLTCKKHGLGIYKLGEMHQRAYRDDSERVRVTDALRARGILTPEDEHNSISSVFLAYRKELLGAAQTLVISDDNKNFVGCTEQGTSDFSEQSVNEWPHPWHIALTAEQCEDRDLHQKLTNLHMQGDIQVGDVLTMVKRPNSVRPSLEHAGYLAKMFAGEYVVQEEQLDSGAIRQTLTRIQSTINANVLSEVPANSSVLETELQKHGHVLVRVGEPVEENKVLKLLIGDGKPMNYRYGNTNRKKVKGTSALEVTPWPEHLNILPHSELTYHTEFPKRMSFICHVPPEQGGETSLYDCAVAYDLLPTALQEKLTQQNVSFRKRYVYKLDQSRYPSWQQVLGEDATANELMAHFRDMGYDCVLFQENDNGELIDVVETQLTRPLVYEYHGRRCLHSSVIGIAPYWYKRMWPDKQPPLTATWENEEPFLMSELSQMEDALLAARIRYNQWREHDVIILDNPRIAHGRLPFKGERVIGALMAQPAQFVKQDGQWTVEAIR